MTEHKVGIPYTPSSAYDEQDVDLYALFNKRYIVPDDGPLQSAAARAAELRENAKKHKAYKISYAKRTNPYKMNRADRVSDRSTDSQGDK